MLMKVQSQLTIVQRHINSNKESHRLSPAEQSMCTPNGHIDQAISAIIDQHLWSSPDMEVESAQPSPFLSAVKDEIRRSITDLLMGDSPASEYAAYQSPMAQIQQMRRGKDLRDCALQLMFDDASLREEQVQEQVCASEIPSSTDSGYSSIESSCTQGHSVSIKEPMTSTPKTKAKYSKLRSLAKQLKRIGKQKHKGGMQSLNMDLLAVL